MAAALQHQVEPAEWQMVEAARLDVQRLSGGLSRSLLAAPPAVVRSVADRAVAAEAVVTRRLARLGDRPELDGDTYTAAVAAEAAYRAARTSHRQARSDRHRLLAWGNAAGVGALGVAGGLALAGVGPMAGPVAAAVVGAAGGPLMALFIAADRCSAAARLVHLTRTQWAEALEATGLPTMGALAARRLAVAGWEQLRHEAEAAREASSYHLRAWHRLAGPGVAPSEVEVLLARVDELRSAQLRLLAALLELHLRWPAPVAPPNLHIQPEPGPEPARDPAPDRAPVVVAPEGRGSWRDEAFNRLRGRKLRLWARR